MKKKLLLLGFICWLSPVAHAKDQIHRATSHVAPVLDDTDDEMTEQEAAAAAIIVPAQHSAFRQWCTAKISIFIAWCMRRRHYIAIGGKKNRTKKRHKHTA